MSGRLGSRAATTEVLDLVCDVVENDRTLGLVVKERLLGELKVEAAELKSCVSVLNKKILRTVWLGSRAMWSRRNCGLWNDFFSQRGFLLLDFEHVTAPPRP